MCSEGTQKVCDMDRGLQIKERQPCPQEGLKVGGLDVLFYLTGAF
jgi:hypothetical protein